MSQETKVYDFASVGQTLDQYKESLVSLAPNKPIGIATPIRMSSANSSLLQMHTNLGLQIKDNLRNMLATNHGERLMLGDYGGNLLPLAYELGTESADTAAVARISATVNKYMPYVSLITFEPIRETSLDGALARVGVRVQFNVPSLSIGEQTVEAMVLSVG